MFVLIIHTYIEEALFFSRTFYLNRVAKKMGTDFKMGTDGHRFVRFQFGIS